jgi:hypothetical protein
MSPMKAGYRTGRVVVQVGMIKVSPQVYFTSQKVLLGISCKNECKHFAMITAVIIEGQEWIPGSTGTCH